MAYGPRGRWRCMVCVFHRPISKICLLEEVSDDKWLLTVEWRNGQIVEFKRHFVRLKNELRNFSPFVGPLCRVLLPNGNYFNVFHYKHRLWSCDLLVFDSSVRKFEAPMYSFAFSSFYGVVFEVFSSLTAALARLFWIGRATTIKNDKEPEVVDWWSYYHASTPRASCRVWKHE